MPLFVTCSQGLEKLLLDELVALGFEECSPGYRGVYVRDDSMRAVYKINYCSRIGGRVLLPLAQFRCYDKNALYAEVKKINWQRFLPKGKTFAIDANVHHRQLRNSLFAAQVMKDAICDQMREATGRRPDVDVKNPDLQLNLFIQKENAILSFDTSGQPLYKRGYRQDSGEAPLQESLAAALLSLAGFKGDEKLLDPCCGSGTLLIEAAMIASKTPPGYLRKVWGFAAHPEFSQAEWLQVKNSADEQRAELAEASFQGCEIDPEIARICRANLRAAGFHRVVEIFRVDFSNYDPSPQPNFLIANPPHGNRLDNVESLVPLYRRLGDFIKGKMAKPGRAFVFAGNLELSKEVGLAPKRRHVIDNSGVDSRLLEFDVYS